MTQYRRYMWGGMMQYKREGGYAEDSGAGGDPSTTTGIVNNNNEMHSFAHIYLQLTL